MNSTYIRSLFFHLFTYVKTMYVYVKRGKNCTFLQLFIICFIKQASLIKVVRIKIVIFQMQFTLNHVYHCMNNLLLSILYQSCYVLASVLIFFFFSNTNLSLLSMLIIFHLITNLHFFFNFLKYSHYETYLCFSFHLLFPLFFVDYFLSLSYHFLFLFFYVLLHLL